MGHVEISFLFISLWITVRRLLNGNYHNLYFTYNLIVLFLMQQRPSWSPFLLHRNSLFSLHYLCDFFFSFCSVHLYSDKVCYYSQSEGALYRTFIIITAIQQLYNNWDYTIPRALWLADACHLLEDRCTNDITAWRDSRTWSKFSQSCWQRFSKLGPKQNKKCSALVEDFNEKQGTKYKSEWKASNSAKHARSLPVC